MPLPNAAPKTLAVPHGAATAAVPHGASVPHGAATAAAAAVPLGAAERERSRDYSDVKVSESSLPNGGWGAAQFGEWMAAFGAAYGAYRRCAVVHGLDGSTLSIVAKEPSDATALEMLKDVGIDNLLHRRRILHELRLHLSNPRG